jgi:hypothetical protein
MNERITPNFSISLKLGEENVLINRIYDNIHLFDWLGHSILKIVGQEGFLQWHTSLDNGVKVAEAADITPVYRISITQEEYDQYLAYQEQFLCDDWLGDVPEV